MATTESIHDKLKRDAYKTTLPYAYKSKNPAVFEAYRQDQLRLHEEFKADLFDELGITDNPKAQLLFEKAWDLGHSAGMHEVFSYASELVDLIT